jgi:hypothetical protein
MRRPNVFKTAGAVEISASLNEINVLRQGAARIGRFEA